MSEAEESKRIETKFRAQHHKNRTIFSFDCPNAILVKTFLIQGLYLDVAARNITSSFLGTVSHT